MDIGTDFFVPIAQLFYSWLSTSVVFFGNSIPIYVFILFALLIVLFIKFLSIIGGIHL